MKPPAARPLIAHVVDKYDSGVRTVIESYIALAPTLDHHVLAGSCVGDVPAAVEVVGGPLPRRALRIRARLHELRPDVVHAHSSVAGAYSRALLPRTNVIYQPHCYAFEALSFPRPARRAFLAVERALARGTAVTIAVGQHEAELARAVVGAPTVRVVPNSTGLDTHAATDHRPRAHAERIVVGSGRICPQKGPDVFASVVSAVRAQAVDVTFLWIGDGDSHLRQVLEDSGVEVTGWLGSDEIRRTLLGADLMLHTAAWEGFPVSIIDAMSLGVPVLARDIAALRAECVHTASDAEALADDVVRALTHTAFRDHLVALSSTISQRMSPSEQARRIHAVYAEVLERAR
ncbi:MAG: glycosyltransferase family 4 protein [Candidatus Phosphoribacter sp.]|jgi:glycosyltransferase involved in cell wall biosynthesis